MATDATNRLEAQPLDASLTCLTLIVLYPELNDSTGKADAGVLLRLADDAAYVAAMRHAQGSQATTALVSDFVFHAEAQLNDLIQCHAQVTATGTRSMLVDVWMDIQRPPFVEPQPLAEGSFVYVLTKAPYEPLMVPRLIAREQHEMDRLADAQHRLSVLKSKR